MRLYELSYWMKQVAILFISLRGNAIKTKHSFTNTVHSWQVVALPLKSQLGGSFSMALGDIIHVLGRPRCGLCCVKKNVQFYIFYYNCLPYMSVCMILYELLTVCITSQIQTLNLKILFEAKFVMFGQYMFLETPTLRIVFSIRVVQFIIVWKWNPHTENSF